MKHEAGTVIGLYRRCIKAMRVFELCHGGCAGAYATLRELKALRPGLGIGASRIREPLLRSACAARNTIPV